MCLVELHSIILQADDELLLRGGPDECDISEEECQSDDSVSVETSDKEMNSSDGPNTEPLESSLISTGPTSESTGDVLESTGRNVDDQELEESDAIEHTATASTCTTSTPAQCENQDTELTDDSDVEDIGAMNRNYQPFRDEKAMKHENEHFGQGARPRNSDSVCSTTSSNMDPKLVKLKVKRQLKKEQAKKHARRIRKAGEASLVTKSRRETTDDIKDSKDWGWC